MKHEHGSPLFIVEHLSKSYTMGEVQVTALRDVTLTIYSGEMVVILGASGSGKSTLMNILGGLDLPTSGLVQFRNVDMSAASERARTQYRRRTVGFVFQFYNLVPSLTALENVQLVTDLVDHALDPREALQLVGLQDRMDHFPSQMSGGEQQRVAIARAVVKRPEVLLCDEPTGALDLATGIVVLDVLDRIHQDYNTTVVLITHNASIAQMADRVVHMGSGSIIEEKFPESRLLPKQLVW